MPKCDDNSVTPADRALLLKLSQTLQQAKREIMDDWLRAVHADRSIQASEYISKSGLEDHLPQLLESVAELLRWESRENSEIIAENARKHGSYRWEQGYRLEEVVRELTIFRTVMIRHIFRIEKEHGPLSPEIRLVMTERLHKMLDELSWSSTQQFVDEQQRNLIHASDSRARLLHNMSHELRNLLNGLSLAAELIEDETAEPVREMQTTLSRSVSHMKELLDDLLDLSALVNGQQIVRPVTFQPASLLKHVLAVYRLMAEEKGLALHAHCDASLETVFGDERKIEQVVINLLSNAIKYTSKGEIRLSFKPVEHDRWSLSVADTGSGISKEDQKQIFSEFYRAESTSQARGVGLGLAISCRLVELLKGELRLESALGEGSRFEVVLPRTFEAALVASRPASLENGQAEPR
ncbi:sensor histidine kinase [Prosthecobacter sp. SYSU 5D2]|uniref:sensor histidine kinase n=1 Tax=Prosthecobacter sp. SYSU 5D2 TaxID=3134134 RepID=UPI0031FED6DE